MGISFHDINWQVDRGVEGALSLEVLKNFPDLIESGECERIKVTAGRRTIYRLKSKSPDLPEYLFIKTYTRPGFKKQVKYLFRASRTRQEWKMADVFKELNLPTAPHLAMGEKKHMGLLDFDALIQEYLHEHMPLDKYLKDSLSGKENASGRNQLIAQFAELVRRLHEMGIFQRDFKPDSIMVKKTLEGFDLRLVDLERARYLKRNLNIRERVKNLATIFHTFELVCSGQDYHEFLQTYYGQDNLSQQDYFKRYNEISALAERLSTKWAWKLRSWVRTENELYHNFVYKNWRIYAHQSMPEAELKNLLDETDRLKAKEISITRRGQKKPSRFVITECRPKFNSRAKGPAGGALFGFENSTVLRHRGLPYIRPYAAIQKRFLGRLRKGFLLAEIPGSIISLKQAWDKVKHDPGNSGMFISRLAGLLIRINKIGLCSMIPLESAIKVVQAEKGELELCLHSPEMLIMEKRGTQSRKIDVVPQIGDMLKMEPEFRDKLKDHLPSPIFDE